MQIAELTAYLTAILPDFYLIGTPRPLQGGLLNMVWRQTALPHNLVVKYAPPHIATAPEVPMDSRRSHFEAQALVWLEQNSEHLPPDVRPPRLIYADPDRALIVMEDLADGLDLAAAWQTLRFDQVQSQAIRIARFLAQLHLKSFQDPKLAQEFDNTGVQNVRLQLQYNLLKPLQEAGIPDAASLAERVTSLGQWIKQPGLCLIMGDLWPPSILVRAERLYLIDWEFAHFGWPVQDVAHLTAHLWMQMQMASRSQQQNVIREAMQAFLTEYRQIVGKRFLQTEPPWLFGVHVGSEILARTLGHFQHGYLYQGLGHDHPRMQEALQFARACILEPEAAWINLLRNK